MTELFDNIIISFENYNSRTQMNHAIMPENSGDTRVKGADAYQGASKLTLQQIRGDYLST